MEHNDLGRALIYASGVFLTILFITYPNRKDRDYVRLSIFFKIFFFILPAIICATEDSFEYLGKIYNTPPGAWLLIGISIWIFIFGYFSRDFIIRSSEFRSFKPHSLEKKFMGIEYFELSLNRVCAFLVCAFAIRFLTFYFTQDVEQEYEVRNGVSPGSHLNVLVMITTGSVYFAAILIVIRLNWRYMTLFFLFGLLIFTFSGSTGRFNAAVAILITLIYMMRISTALICLFFPILLISAFPILASGKLLIFSIATNAELPSVSVILQRSTEVSSYIDNFAHPMVSLFQVERLLALSNLRWFYDFPHGLMFYLKVFGFDMGPSLTYYNTESFLGYKSSIVPTGYLAFGFAQMSYFGVFIMGVFYRCVFYIFINMRYIKSNLSPISSFYIALVSANTFYTGEVRTLILQYFLNMIVINACFWLVSKRSVRSTHFQVVE